MTARYQLARPMVGTERGTTGREEGLGHNLQNPHATAALSPKPTGA